MARKALPAAVALIFGQAAWGQAINATGNDANLPVNGTSSSATGSVTGNTLSISLPDRAVIDWSSFNIGAGYTVNFSGAGGAVLNRVPLSGPSSSINGNLNGSGIAVMLMNPNGILFGPSAVVNVGTLVATTGTIDETRFRDQGVAAITNASGSVRNQGHITAETAGLVALVAPSVINEGTITATGGTIALAGTTAATYTMSGGLYEFAVTGPGTEVTNAAGATLAGATIYMSTGDAANLVSGTINLSGVQQATRIEVNGNHVVLASDLNATTVTGASRTVDVCSCGQIQDGIDIAAGGGRVNVAAGTYHEQLRINKSLSLAGAGADATIITPTSLAADADGMRNIVTIGGGPATSVEVSGLQLKGPVPSITAGIFVRDGAHAHVHDNKLIDMRESAALSGNQTGVGIFVGRAKIGTSGTAVIERNVITGYQKGGIVVDGPGSQAAITGNTVTGEGPTTVIAQNGIQVSRGASATVDGNIVTRNAYTGVRSDPDDFAAGILFFISGPYLGQGGMDVGAGNTITANEFGIWTNDARTLATTSLSGVSGNTRNAVAFFNGGYAGQGPLLEYPAWSAANTAYVSSAAFSGKQSGDIVDAGGTLRVFGWSGFAAIQPAIDAVASGGTVDVAGGTYTQTSTLNVHKSITLAGAGQAQTTIDASGVSGYGMLVDADQVSLANFTLWGPAGNSASSYGIKVQPAGSTASSRLHDFSITNVTSRGAFKAELDLNGVVGATIDRVTADGAPVGNDAGTTAGAGIQVTDSANVVIRNSTTRNNAWGGVALFQANRFFDQRTTNISVENNNHFTEALPLYMQDESASLDFGALNLLGFSHAVRNSGSAGNSQFTWLQSTLQNAIDFAVNVPVPASSTVQGWSGTGLTQSFQVGVGNVLGDGARAMSIAAAIAASGSGAGINVGAGTYAENVALDGVRNLTFGGSTIRGLTVNPGAAGSGIRGSAVADGPSGFVFNAPVVLLGDTTLGTAGANIVFNADIQNAGANPNALTLTAGSGDITLTSGGTPSNPLDQLHAVSRNFTLRNDMWVTGSAIEVTGTAVLNGQLRGPASVAARLIEELPEEVPPQVLVPPVQVSTNTGAGLLSQPGSPVADFTSSLPPAGAGEGGTGGGGNVSGAGTGNGNGNGNGSGPGQSGRSARLVTPPGGAGNAQAPRSTPGRAGEALDRGRSVEIDLAPGNDAR